MKTITEADLISPHKMNLNNYKNQWHRGSMKKRLRALYENNKVSYTAAYRPEKPDFYSEQEYGMKVFRACERKIMNQYWESKGEVALLKSVDMLRTRSTTLPLLDNGVLDSELTELPILISMDIEGNTWDRGISELGIATLDLREFYQEKHCWPVIHSTNYILNCRSRRKFLFNSSSQRIDGSDMAKLRDVISSSLSIPDPLTE